MKEYVDQQQTGYAPLAARQNRHQRWVWWLSSALAAVLVVCFLPVGQIQMRGDQLKGLIGGQGYSGWIITLTGGGSISFAETDMNGNNIPPFPQTDTWGAQQNPGTNSITAMYSPNVVNSYINMEVQATGTIHVVCTWNGYGPPPAQIYLQKYVSAMWNAYDYNWLNSGNGSGSSDDGCNDPCVPNPFGGISQGYHISQYDSSSGTVTFDIPVQALATLAASGNNGPGDGGQTGIIFNCTVNVVNPSVEGASTDFPLSYNPLWFSGTDCQVQGTASVPGGQVLFAQLLVNGEEVNCYDNINSTYSSVTLAATFDSTYFSDGSTINLEIFYIDQDGNTYTSQISAFAYNKAYILGNNTLTSSQDVSALLANLAGSASSMNHTPQTSTTDSKATILSNLPIYTAFFIDTHGFPPGFNDCLTGNVESPEHTIYDTDITTTIANKQTTGQNPNTWLYPPYNLVQLFACDCGGDLPAGTGVSTDLANCFGISSSSVDKACLAFDTEVISSNANTAWAERIWENLSIGDTLSFAIAMANADGEPTDVIEYNQAGEPTWTSGIANQVIFGDPSMKLHGVYGGIQLNWYISGAVTTGN